MNFTSQLEDYKNCPEAQLIFPALRLGHNDQQSQA